MLSGDASTAVENALVHDYTQTGGEIFSFEAETAWGTEELSPGLADIDFLKVPHHGGAGSTGEALLSLCRPRLYFISCGRGNGYFHPSSDTLARIRAAVPEAEFFRTDDRGASLIPGLSPSQVTAIFMILVGAAIYVGYFVICSRKGRGFFADPAQAAKGGSAAGDPSLKNGSAAEVPAPQGCASANACSKEEDASAQESRTDKSDR